jgi:hypothetical protein
VEAAYRRSDLFAKRVALMNDWAAYLAQPAVQVVPLRVGRQGAGGSTAASLPRMVVAMELLA